MEKYAAEHGIARAEDWKGITARMLAAAGGGALLHAHSFSVHALLLTAFPEDEALRLASSCRNKLPKGYWADLDNRRRFVEDLACRYGVEQLSSLMVSPGALKELRSSTATRRYGGSVTRLLADTFPEIGFAPATRKVAYCGAGGRRPRGHWESLEHQRRFVEETAAALGVREARGWAQVSASDIRRRGGAGLLNRHGSLPALLEATVGTEAAEAARTRLQRYRPRVARGHWGDRERRRAFLLQLAEKHGVRETADWRNVGNDDVRAEPGGSGFLKVYEGSLFRALEDLLGEEEIAVTAVRPAVKQEAWTNAANVRAFLEAVKEQLCIEEKADWFRISRKEVISVTGGFSFARSSLMLRDALALAYPDEEWPEATGNDGIPMKKSKQRLLRLAVRRLFPSVTLLEDYRSGFTAGAKEEPRKAGPSLELDLYMPDHQLAFEYNGVQHYHEVAFFGPLEAYQRRDEAKRRACREHGIRLLEVPYWWDGQVASLAASLHHRFPGLLQLAHAPQQ